MMKDVQQLNIFFRNSMFLSWFLMKLWEYNSEQQERNIQEPISVLRYCISNVYLMYI